MPADVTVKPIEGEFQEEVLRLFAQEASGWIGQIKAALWELELGPAPDRVSVLYAAMQRDVATLKGSAGTVNLVAVEELALAVLSMLAGRPDRPNASAAPDTAIKGGIEVLTSIVKVLNLAPKKTAA